MTKLPDGVPRLSRRTTLSSLAGLIVGASTLAPNAADATVRSKLLARAQPSQTPIAILFAQWLAVDDRWRVYEQRVNGAYDIFQRLKPIVPEILKLENAPSRWARLLKKNCLGEPLGAETPMFHRIPLHYINESMAGVPDAWLIEAKEAAEHHEAADNRARIAAGMEAIDEDAKPIMDELEAFSERIISQPATNLTDIQAQVVVTAAAHKQWLVGGPYEERLFASILAVATA